MPWRVIAHGDQVWHVDALAERPANTEAWQLVLSFRSASGRPGRSFRTLYPLEATSKSSLFIQARSEEHTSELQSRLHLVCRLLLEKKKRCEINVMHTLVGVLSVIPSP